MKRLGILLSGRGSNFRAIADSIAAGRLQAEIGLVLSNREEAPGLAIAKERNLPSICLRSRGVAREDYDGRLLELLKERGVDLVCLAGYMRLLTPEFVRAFAWRIVNIHPSLLPAFPGLEAQKQALEHGVKVTGCTAHFVDEFLDTGPIIRQAAVPVFDDDTEEMLAARILKEEHRIYPEAIGQVLAGGWRIAGRRVIWGGRQGE